MHTYNSTVGLGLGLGDANYFSLSAAGMVGIEYSFAFPLQISLDFRQHIGIGLGGHGLWTPSSVGLGIRYKFQSEPVTTKLKTVTFKVAVFLFFGNFPAGVIVMSCC